jgi:hypothetical protein
MQGKKRKTCAKRQEKSNKVQWGKSNKAQWGSI